MELGSTIPVPQIIYRDINESDYLKLFSGSNNNILGGALSDISVFETENYSNLFRKNNRAGAGVFSFLSNIAKRSFPFLKKYILPEAINFGTSLIEKSKNNPSSKISKEDIKSLGKTSIKNIAKKVIDSGGRRVKKASLLKKSRKGQKKHNTTKRGLKVKKVNKFKKKRGNKISKHAIFNNV